ncbi:MAG: glucans biosynthesis glucosyltransferase MdoH [Proteobacteria bacterium]|nr:MAG: glucans biosynthesis glucosyltransferase MdoH [Pseudomonadota bacterium]
MSEHQVLTSPLQAVGNRGVLTTPTGTQSMEDLRRRRLIVLALNVSTFGLLIWAAINVLKAGGWSLVDTALLIAFAVGSPWTVLGFWNSVIGLWLLHGVRDPITKVAPYARAGDLPTPITVRTAILMTLRNEDPERAILRLKTVKESIDATGFGEQFGYFVLSDTDDPSIAEAEEKAVAAWQRTLPDPQQVIYRRRADNTGFKAGNLRDFCERWGREYELMLPLDADSLMSGDTVIRLVRIMQAHRQLGILQSLVVGMPSSSAFARIFQFGMRHGMRSYTMGQAWWTGDCGPFWGHNAVVRIRPFLERCQLPVLPGKPPLGGHVLSHDQVEATLMRRAGYEVRVLPFECGSWEENPPTLLEFIRRDVRWCQGNMQYLKLLDMPGLHPMSRFQLIWAILMFLGIPAWTLMIALLPVLAYEAQSITQYPTALAVALYVGFFLMYLSPKIAGLLDVVLTRGGVRRYGGRVRFAISALIELVFSFLLGAVSTIRTTIFMIGLLFGKSVTWGGQARDAHGISWRAALVNLWPQTVFGLVLCSVLAAISPTVLAWSLPLTAGYLLAIPFAVITAHPDLGRLLRSWGLCGIPEDFEAVPEIEAVQLNRP